MFKRLVFGSLIFLFSLSFITLPNLTDRDVKAISLQLFNSHVKYKSLNEELIERILNNFFEELDPTKTYLIENEIVTWIHPTSKTKQKIAQAFEKANFDIFNTLFQTMQKSINRRAILEKEIASLPPPQVTNNEEFKNLKWSTSPKELKERLLKIKALQSKGIEKLKPEEKEVFLQRIEKYRLSREQKLLPASNEEKKKLVLSYVLKAFANALDSHTDYFTPQEAKSFVIQVQQKLTGIGAILTDSINGFEILRMIEGGPADRSKKIKIKDKIVAIDNKPVIGMDINDVVEMIHGKKNSKVNLTLLRYNKESNSEEKIEIAIIRDDVIIEEGRFDSNMEVFGDGVIAHLKLFSFYQDSNSSSTQDLSAEIEKIQKNQKLKAVILDLRNNAGGLLPQAVSICSLFINKGIVVSIKDSNGKIQHLRNTNNKTIYEGPLIILTNKASASASEIVAQTLQDYGRAIIVGDDSTFGKGSFQTFTLDSLHSELKVNPQGEYKVTQGLYFTVSGKSPQKKGVKADIVVPSFLSYQEIGEEFLKYPLENETIKANFSDDLTDIPPIYRNKIEELYKHNLQKKLTLYTQLLPLLKTNSTTRLQNNKNYQNSLKELQNKNFDAPFLEGFWQNDPQLLEALNITKDLIYFLELNEKEAACY